MQGSFFSKVKKQKNHSRITTCFMPHFKTPNDTRYVSFGIVRICFLHYLGVIMIFIKTLCRKCAQFVFLWRRFLSLWLFVEFVFIGPASGTSSGLLRFSYTTMIMIRMMISASTPRSGHKGAR